MRDKDQDDPEDRPVWAWIDQDALAHNARLATQLASGRAVIGVVKADGYGHGAETIARGLLAEGVTRLAVVSVGEGAALRRAGIMSPILLMGELGDHASLERALKWNLVPVLHGQEDFERLRAVARASAPISVEVEVDTGMHRMGVPERDAGELLRSIAGNSALTLSGLYTHLACADESDPGPSQKQVERLAAIVEAADLSRDGLTLHVSNSAGLLRIDEIETKETGLETQAVRPGLMLYGVSPFPERPAAELGLRPVMSLVARVVGLRDVEAGRGVGYGSTWTAPSGGARIATLPLGYADGLPRALLGRGEVFLGGAYRRIVGRVSMDYIGVDVTEAAGTSLKNRGPVRIGDVATIFGATAEGVPIPVERLAAAAGTIGYEMLTSVGNRVPRRAGQGPPPMADWGDLDRAV